MIVHAIQTVLSGELASKVSVKGIIAPFDSLGLFSPVYKDRAGPNVLALLGNTLGNMSDDWGFLETLHASMWSGDMLLLEVRCHVDQEAGHAPGIGEEAKKRFNFGPLEDLGAVYEDHRDLISIRRERSRSVIPNTVTTVTQCERVTVRRQDVERRPPGLRARVLRARPRAGRRRHRASPSWRKFPGGMRGVDQRPGRAALPAPEGLTDPQLRDGSDCRSSPSARTMRTCGHHGECRRGPDYHVHPAAGGHRAPAGSFGGLRPGPASSVGARCSGLSSPRRWPS